MTTRRRFIRTAAAAALASPLILRGAAPSERVRLGFIACGGRARQILPMFLSSPHAQVVAVSDVMEPRMAQFADTLAKRPDPMNVDQSLDYRRLLDRKDLDAVVIATNQHQHGLPFIHACQAGKHIFVEKPLAHSVAEGRAMVSAAKKHNILAMMGTQQRAGQHYQQAVELIRAGRLGKIPLVHCWNYHNTGARAGRHPVSDPPAGLHWDLWLGPAPATPFTPSRFGYYSWWFDYAGGMLTDWAIHHIDIILWAMNSDTPQSISCTGGKFVVDDLADTPDTIEASWRFPGWIMQYSYRGYNNFHSYPFRPNHHGICFQGSKATLILDRFGYEIWDPADPSKPVEKVSGVPYFDAKNPLRSEQDGPWHRAFIDCIRENRQPPLSLEQSHRATVCCQLANIAYRTNRSVQWNPSTESISDNPPASALLQVPRRKGYELPAI